jgi:serine/threonine-protein kinase
MLARGAATSLCVASIAASAAWAAESEPPTAREHRARMQLAPLERLVPSLPARVERGARATWRRWAPELERRLNAGLRRIPPAWRPYVTSFRRFATDSESREVVLWGGLLALLIAMSLGRRRGEVVVSIEYPRDLRGFFGVRLETRKPPARSSPGRATLLSTRAAATRNAQQLVERETRFRRVSPRAYWVCVEGELCDADLGMLQEERSDARRVLVRPGRTARVEFDFRPATCALAVTLRWNGRPVPEAAVAIFGRPDTLRYAPDGDVRLELPVGSHRVSAGSGDRVAELAVEVETLRPMAVEIDLGGPEVLFRGCPDAVTPYLNGDLTAAARALEREGQLELAQRLRATLHEQSGGELRAAALYGEAGDSESAVRVLERVSKEQAQYADACIMLADHFEHEGELEHAIARIEQAIDAASGDTEVPELYSRLASLRERCGDVTGALLALELLRSECPDDPEVDARIEALCKESSRESRGAAGTAGAAERAPRSRYEIVEQIGSGGMGVVFRARDRRLGREVALKRLAESVKDHPLAVDLFRREARAAAALNHPNIVTLFDADEEDGRFFITMELLDGETLSALLRRYRRLGARDVVLLGRQVAAGLQYAHARRIVHRDIKPSNLFFTRDKLLKIMDFGLAKMIEEVRRQSTVVAGTPFYMAPELSSGGAVDTSVDMYSLGVSLFALLTGRVPFRDGDVIHHHRHTPPPDPRGLVEDLPETLAALVLELLAKRPEQRPDAAQVGERLEALARAELSQSP